MKDGDQEGRRLAGAGLGLHGGVGAFQGDGQGPFLDVGRLGVSPLGDGLQEAGIEVQFFKTHYSSLWSDFNMRGFGSVKRLANNSKWLAFPTRC